MSRSPTSVAFTWPIPSATVSSWWRRTEPLRRALPWLALVAGLTAAAAWERGTTAPGAPLWIDEGISLGIASHPLASIPGLLRQDGSPPLYYLLLHWWVGLFGSTPTAAHALSVLFAVLAVPAAAWAAWRPFGPRAGVLAGGLAAFSPFLGLYADETRMYSLAFLLAVLATGAFARGFALGSRRWAAACGALVGALCLTHGWGLFFAASTALAGLVAIAAGPRRRALLVNGLVAAGVALAVFAAWIPTFVFQAKRTGAPWSHVPDAKSLNHAVRLMVEGKRPELLLFVVAGGGLAVVLRRRPRPARVALVGAATIAAGTLLAGYLASRADQPAWALRYFTVPLAPLVVALGAGLDAAGPAGVIAALVVCLGLWAGKPTAPALSDKSNVDRLAVAMRGELPGGTVVASPQPEQVPLLRRDLGPGLRFVTPLGRPADPTVVDWVDALERLRASRVSRTLAPAVRELAPGERVLLVSPEFGNPDSPWTIGVGRRNRTWRRWLEHDARLVMIDRYVPERFASRATVSAMLFERVRHPEHGRARLRVALRLLPRLEREEVRDVLSRAAAPRR